MTGIHKLIKITNDNHGYMCMKSHKGLWIRMLCNSAECKTRCHAPLTRKRLSSVIKKAESREATKAERYIFKTTVAAYEKGKREALRQYSEHHRQNVSPLRLATSGKEVSK